MVVVVVAVGAVVAGRRSHCVGLTCGGVTCSDTEDSGRS